MNNAATVLHANAKSESVHFVVGKRTILKKTDGRVENAK